MASVAQVEASRPQRLTQSAVELGQRAASLSSQIDTQRSTLHGLRSTWHGAASDAAVANAQPTLLRMQQIHDALHRAQAVLLQGGSQLVETRTSVLHNVSQLKGQGWLVRPDGTVTVSPGTPLDRYARASPVNAMKSKQLAATNSLTVKTLLAGFDAADRQLDQGLRAAVGDGTRTDYPSMEVYQDLPDGTSHTVLIDPAAHGGQQGPMTNLPFHHDVGAGGKAFAPFDTGGWNPKYDVPTPLPGTAFGSVDDPPSAAPPPPTGAVPA